MFIIPRELSSILTFPGTVVHEWAHKLAAENRGLRVSEVCYFRIDSPPGYVKHEHPPTYFDDFLVTFAPLMVNTLVALGLFVLNPFGGTVFAIVAALTVMIGMGALPSKGDATSLWKRAKRLRSPSTFVTLSLPVVAILYVADKLRFLWLDFFYGIGLLTLGIYLKIWIATSLPF